MTRNAIGPNEQRRAMQVNGGDGKRPVARMSVKRRTAAALLLCLAPLLGSCGGASENGFSAYVADHWPHWAGGMPSDVPPRPGAPGYNEFIAHGQADQATMQSAAPAAKSVAANAKPQPAPAPSAAPAAPADEEPSDDLNVRQGGLY